MKQTVYDQAQRQIETLRKNHEERLAAIDRAIAEAEARIERNGVVIRERDSNQTMDAELAAAHAAAENDIARGLIRKLYARRNEVAAGNEDNGISREESNRLISELIKENARNILPMAEKLLELRRQYFALQREIYYQDEKYNAIVSEYGRLCGNYQKVNDTFCETVSGMNDHALTLDFFKDGTNQLFGWRGNSIAFDIQGDRRSERIEETIEELKEAGKTRKTLCPGLVVFYKDGSQVKTWEDGEE